MTSEDDALYLYCLGSLTCHALHPSAPLFHLQDPHVSFPWERTQFRSTGSSHHLS